MAEPFIGEIKMFAFPWAPKDYANCNGQIEAVSSNQALFSLLGTQFGGNGSSTFGYPDLRGRIPIGMGTLSGFLYQTGQKGGGETVTLTQTTTPTHTHQLYAKSSPTTSSATPNTGEVLSDNIGSPSNNVYSTDDTSLVELNSGTCTVAGNSQGHNNMMPYGVINFCIALQGAYPQRN